MLRKSLFLLVFPLLMSKSSVATTFYVSPKGNDAFDGKSPSNAWQTLPRVNLAINKLVTGDSILFQRGCIFYGTLQIVGEEVVIKGIYIGAYGRGENPVISGAVEIKNWKPFKRNIWMATWPSNVNAPSDIFLDGVRQTLGRYPNAGYNSITQVTDVNVFRDATLPHADGLWDGAEVVVRCNRWILNKLLVGRYHKKSFYVDSISSYPIKAGNDYFIQNHLATLDQPGEWFFDSTQRVIYLVLQPSTQRNEHRLTASVLSYGIVIQKSSEIALENLTVKFYKQAAVDLVSCDKISVRNCTFVFGGNIGLRVVNCNQPFFANNTITDIHNLGVYWNNVKDGLFVENTIRKIGMIPGRGQSGDGSYIGLFVMSTTAQAGHTVIQYNKIDSIGYSAIDFRQGNTLIKNNVISDFCLVKDDGAAIYTWHNAFRENAIEENIIVFDRTPIWTSQALVSGIYIDDLSSGILVQKNTVAYCPTAGIYIHNASKVDIVENRLFGNGTNLLEEVKGQLYINYDMPAHESGFSQPELVVYKNSFTSTYETTACIFFGSDFLQDYRKLGKLNCNIYQAQKPTQAVIEFHRLQAICDATQSYDLPTWQQESGLDSGSVFYPIQSSNSQSGNDLVLNGNFENNEDGWITWPPLAKHSVDATTLHGNPSLRASIFLDHPGALLYYNTVSLKKEKIYRLSFTGMASRPGNLEFSILTAEAPWRPVTKYICLGVDKEARTYHCYFQVREDCDRARINFKFRNTLWIDNVSIQEVQPDVVHNKTITLLYNPTTKPIHFSEARANNDNAATLELLPFSSIIINRAKK